MPRLMRCNRWKGLPHLQGLSPSVSHEFGTVAGRPPAGARPGGIAAVLAAWATGAERGVELCRLHAAAAVAGGRCGCHRAAVCARGCAYGRPDPASCLRSGGGECARTGRPHDRAGGGGHRRHAGRWGAGRCRMGCQTATGRSPW
eukprot:ctg_809.g395